MHAHKRTNTTEHLMRSSSRRIYRNFRHTRSVHCSSIYRSHISRHLCTALCIRQNTVLSNTPSSCFECRRRSPTHSPRQLPSPPPPSPSILLPLLPRTRDQRQPMATKRPVVMCIARTLHMPLTRTSKFSRCSPPPPPFPFRLQQL